MITVHCRFCRNTDEVELKVALQEVPKECKNCRDSSMEATDKDILNQLLSRIEELDSKVQDLEFKEKQRE